MTSLTDLREVVDVVIGVDTHVHTHSRGRGRCPHRRGARRDHRRGHRRRLRRSWWSSPTSTPCCGRGRSRAPAATVPAWPGTSSAGEEVVIELDRPERAKRRNGAKSDPLDAIRAAREALARPRLGTPRSGGDRQALSVLLAARRSAVDAATDGPAAAVQPGHRRPRADPGRFRGQKLPAMIKTAAALRIHASWDVETTTTVTVLRSLARRARALTRGSRRAREGHPGHRAVLAPRPARAARRRTDRGRDRALRLVPPRPDPLRGGLRHARRRRTDPSQQRPGHHPAPAQPLRRPPAQPRPAHHRAVTHPLRPDHPRLRRPTHQPKARPPARSNAASSATSPETSTDYSNTGLDHLTIHRSVGRCATSSTNGAAARPPQPTGSRSRESSVTAPSLCR